MASFAETVAAPDDLWTQYLWRSTRGKLLAREGQLDEGVQMVREAVRLAHTSDDPVAQGNALLDLAEVLEAAGQVVDARASIVAAAARFEAKGNLVSVATAAGRMAALDERGDVSEAPVDVPVASLAIGPELEGLDQVRGMGRIG
jgi:hypothetical protein